MKFGVGTGVLGLLVVALLALNAQLALAHRWNKWHQNSTSVGYHNTAVRHAEAEAAIEDWKQCAEPKLVKKSSHTDISVFDGNYGATGWGGLASIKDTEWDWWCSWWCGIQHGHARYNAYYGGSGGTGTGSDIRGIFCQEVGHLFGLGHSNDGCMGKSYFNNSNVVVAHNCNDAKSYTH